ncbi:MAG TPA: MFS transporter [Actinomycetes bacterium]|nr:MFS transporter [Actinomycetes bacterium]
MGCHGLQSPAAVGVWATANFLALPLGPILGGWLLTNYWWGWAFLINVPVVLVGLLAVIVLLPESRSATRAGLDPVGVLSSSAGLTVLVYGVIEAGQHGWGDTMALTAMIAGTLLLVGFVAWERRLGRRPAGQPLVDLGLFRSTSFTWGTILAAVGIFALFGVLFTAPQYFQAVLGTDAMGSGLRLLPLIGGDPGQRAQRHLQGQLHLAGVPARVADAVRDSVFAGVAAAQQLGSVSLLHSVRTAFVDGMDVMLWVCAGIAVAGIVLALVFLPGRAAAAAATQAEPAALEDEAVVRG